MAGPWLETERLELWQPDIGDIHPLFAIVSEENTRRYLGPEPTMPDHFMRFTRNAGSWSLYGYGLVMIRERGGDGRLLGNCGIFHSFRGLGEDFDDRPEAGWILSEEAAGKGYAGEAMRAIFDWFDREFGAEVVCLIEPANAPSIRLADKLGFEPLREANMPDGSPVNLYRRLAPAR